MSTCRLHLVVLALQVYRGTQISLRISAPQGAAVLVRSLPTKSRKGVARDVFDPFATQARLVHDVTETDCWARRECFRDFPTAVFISQDRKSGGRISVCLFFSPFLSTGPSQWPRRFFSHPVSLLRREPVWPSGKALGW